MCFFTSKEGMLSKKDNTHACFENPPKIKSNLEARP